MGSSVEEFSDHDDALRAAAESDNDDSYVDSEGHHDSSESEFEDEVEAAEARPRPCSVAGKPPVAPRTVPTQDPRPTRLSNAHQGPAVTGTAAGGGPSTINRLARPLGSRQSMGGARGVAPRASPGGPNAAAVAAANTPRGAVAGVAGGSGISSSSPVAARECGEEDGEGLSEAELQERREANIKALLSNSLQTCRQPIMSKFLTLAEGEAVLRKPFTSPLQGAPAMSDALRRRLVARRHFVPWGSSTPLPVPTVARTPATPAELVPEPEPQPALQSAEEALPEGIEPLVLWQEPQAGAQAEGTASGADGGGGGGGGGGGRVVVDNMLVRWLRPHQREGVQFMFDCVTGQRIEDKHGCILADDMGLGKTLQGITLLWTLLQGGHAALGGDPVARRAIIVCPTSLVSNWDNECQKWLKGRLRTLALCESSREDVVANIQLFLHPANVYKVLIVSYETFRLHSERFQVPHACDLLICDEAHRLKNDATLTNRALDNLACKRRVLLSGTPMQNHLDEFFAMVDFCNPGVLGAPAQFRKYFELPILAGREPDASAEQVALGEERSRELSSLTNRFILRRTNKLLSQHLPPKVIEVVCCRLTELQRQLYCHFLASKAARRVLSGRSSGVLSAITSLKKLCNHPKLIYDAVHSKAAAAAAGDEEPRAEGFEDVGSLFPPGLFDNGRPGRGGMALGWEATSGKMAVLARMLHVLYTETNDRIVLVSNYTSMLDLFVQLCRERGYPFVRLDGTTTINKRQKLVKVFNDPAEKQFAFLLSSKAGGCGLNLIGANRLVLFDPDWNPANDQQAAARVWRDGQRKRVFVYRFLSTGSIEEKVYQRQLSKEGLKQLVSKNGKAAANVMTAEDLRELFSLNADSISDTYECMCGGAAAAAAAAGTSAAAAAAVAGAEAGTGEAAAAADGQAGADGAVGGQEAAREVLQALFKLQVGEPAEEDLASWGHHPTPDTVPDAVMARVAQPDVSFIFSCRVSGKHIEGGDEEEQRIAAGTGAAARAAPMRQAAGRGAAAVARVSSRRGSGAGGPAGAAGAPTPVTTTSLAAAAAASAVTKPVVCKGPSTVAFLKGAPRLSAAPSSVTGAVTPRVGGGQGASGAVPGGGARASWAQGRGVCSESQPAQVVDLTTQPLVASCGGGGSASLAIVAKVRTREEGAVAPQGPEPQPKRICAPEWEESDEGEGSDFMQ